MTIPAGSLAFSGFGDAPMVFLAPDGTTLTPPVTAPDCGPGCLGLLASTVTDRVLQAGGFGPPTNPPGATMIFDTDWTVHSVAAGTTGGSNGIGRDAAGHWYVTLGARIRRLDEACVQTGEWTVSFSANPWKITASAVNAAGSIAYVAAYDNLVGSPLQPTVYGWDLVGNVSLGVFASDAGSGFYPTGDTAVLTLTTGDVLIGYAGSGAAIGYLKHYSPSGTLLHTYALSGTGPKPTVVTPGLDDTSIWVSYFRDDLATPSGVTVAELQIGTGTVLHSFDPKDGDFEFDGPFCVVRAGGVTPPPIPPAPPGAIEPIRRLRQAPHLWTGENTHRLKYPGFQLLVESGAPRDTDGPMSWVLQWSDDGGHSWSHEHRIEGSRLGEHTFRFWWRRLGQSRDRVFRVVNSDDAKIVVIDALLVPDPVEGSS